MEAIPANLEDGRRNLRPELVPSIFLDRAEELPANAIQSTSQIQCGWII